MIIRDGEIIPAGHGSRIGSIILTLVYLGATAMFAVMVAETDNAAVGLYALLMTVVLFALTIAFALAATRRVEFRADRIRCHSVLGTKEMLFSEVTSEQWVSGKGMRSLLIFASHRTMHLGNPVYDGATLTAIHDEIAARCRMLGREILPPPLNPISIKGMHHALSISLWGMIAAMALIIWAAMRHHTGA